MALCVSCGKELKDGARFCVFCGAAQPAPQAPAAAQPPAPQSPSQTPPTPASYTPAPAPYAPAAPVYTPAPVKKKKSKAPLIIGILLGAIVLIVGLVLLAVFVILPLFGGGVKPAEENPIYGRYNAVSVEAFGSVSEPSGEWVELKKNGKGTFYSDGNEYKLKWSLDGETFTGEVTVVILNMDMNGTLKDGVLRVEYGFYQYTFLLEGKELPSTPGETQTGAEPDTGTGAAVPESEAALNLALIADYEGDWHGVAQFYNCSGAYEDNDFALAEVIMRLSFDEKGNLTPYLRMDLKGFEDRAGFGSSGESGNFPNLRGELDSAHDSVALTGTFFSGTLDNPTYAVVNANGSLTITTTVTASDGSFDLYMVLRRPDEAWSDEDDPRLTDSGVEYYMGMGLSEIAEEFGLDPSLIPAFSSVGEGPEEGAPTD